MPLIGSFIQQAALYDAQWGEGSYKVEWDIRINSNWNHKKSYLLKMLVQSNLANKERFDKEQISIKEPFLVTNLPITS